ncbi:hypothetical protein KL920_000055 [Ogataea angusta]|nr:hypothetical protein KL920_000055 [Ogataea angusta]
MDFITQQSSTAQQGSKHLEVNSDVYELNSEHDKPVYTTKRGLKSRHVQFIALAGAIGTGIFVGSGSTLATCGPASLLIGFLILVLFVWSIMNQLGEMVSFIPAPGKSTLYALCDRYTGNKTMSFTCGMNLLYALCILTPAEISAAAFVIEYWSDLNVAIWITILWSSIVAINLLAVKFFGETEFWIASIKLITIIGLIVLGFAIFWGAGPDRHGILGFHYWKHPGAFVEHLVPGNTGKFLACWTSIIKSAFAFVLSPEIITSAAAEAEAPRKNLPKATSRFIYRLMIFYIGGVLAIGIIVGSDDPRLMNAINSGNTTAAASPFVIGIQNAGIKYLNHIVNAAILTSAYSAGNSFLYASTRTLYSMSLTGIVPRFFSKCTRYGVPIYCVIFCSAIALLSFLNVSNSSTAVFNWLSNISTVSGFISWIFVSITYLRYRKAITYHQLDSRVTYRPRYQIFGAYACLIFFTVIALTNGYAVFFNWKTSDFFAAYITLPIVAVIYVSHMLWTRNFRLFAPPEHIDCFTGLEDTEKEAAVYVPPVPRNFIERFWFWLT